jgi:hypothetical protein
VARQTPKIRFVHRTGCSLCEAMWSEFEACRAGLPADIGSRLEVDVVDLVDHPELEARYGQRIPVLELERHEVCRYFFDETALRASLSRLPIAV